MDKHQYQKCSQTPISYRLLAITVVSDGFAFISVHAAVKAMLSAVLVKQVTWHVKQSTVQF
ncbi:hypothetical protein L8R84_20905 [Vibrio splendidus]|uniref:hypothetical protein n=1 Tax=Vibrio TaxID=662 RepID=UPI00246842C9|nr:MULTISPECIES: hypothetical protein [Vibrio]MDH5938564.1 hypothetical protein [Vibrio splendidus]MDH5967731.1 hypothetical protein [Vibrio aestuarianus]